MSRHKHLTSGVVVSVDDSKDERFDGNWGPADDAPRSKAPAKKSATTSK